MTTDNTNASSGQSQTQPNQSSTGKTVATPKLVPEADLLAVKAKGEKAEAAVAKAASEINSLKDTIAELKAQLATAEASDVDGIKKQILKQQNELKKGFDDLDKQRRELDRTTTASKLAAKYGLKAEDLLTADNIHERALELYHESLANRSNSNGRFESGNPSGVGKKAISDFTPSEFEAYLAEQKKLALARK